MQRTLREKVFSVFLMAVMFLQSLLPYLSLIKNTYASTPTNSEIDYSTDTNTLKLTVNTVDEVEYLVAYRSEKKIEAFQGKADASDQNFSREFYAGTCSTNDTCTPDFFKKVITKVRIETSNWTQVRRVVYIGGGFLTASEDSDGDVDKLSEEEEDWLNNQDDLDLQPTATPSPTTEVTPTGDILDGISVTATPTATPSVGQDGAVVTEVIESNACFANSLNGCVASEKPDYHPNEVVLLYGHGFEANTEYALVITSETDSYSGEYKITTDGNGSFFYSYQLENVYRPLYKVEVKDSEGNVVASTTFTDSPISGCAIDSAGANDETGQKDLTKMCVDYSGHPTSITTSWNWDEISWSGANTGDACSLFDNDGDGFVNYALCVGVNGNPAIEAYTKLYSCTDTKGYNCSGSSLISSSPSSSCATTLENTDPFAAGAGYPVDTQASCNVVMSEVGGSSSELVDVCSYPSGSPSSKASDCVVFKDKSGKLEVKKVLIPSDNTGLFNLQIDGATAGTGADAGDGDTTGEQVVTADDHTVGETAGTGTSLSNYSSSIVCKDLNGSGTTIASASNAGPLDIVVEEGDDIVCTITNTLQNGSVKVNKLLDGDSNGTFETSNPGAFTWSLDGSGTNVMGSTVSNVTPGSHNVNEASVSNYHFVGWYPTSSTQYTCSNIPQGNSTLPASVSVTSNATTEITLCNARDKGTIKVVKDVVPTDNSQWDVSVSGPTNNTDTLTDADDTGVLPSLTGSYTISETAHAGTTGSNYTSTWSCNNNTSGQGTSISNLTLAKDQNLVCTFTNTIKKGDVRVVKYHDHDADGTKDVGDEVLGDTGVGAEIEATRWAIKLVGDNVNSTQYTGAAVQGEVTFSDLLPGNFTLSEVIKTGWHQSNISCTGDQGIDNDNSHAVTVYPDTETTCYIGNYQKGTISGYKYDADGTTVIQNWSIDLYECLSDFSGCVLGASTTTDSNGFFSFANLNVGFYKVQEVVQSGWTALTSLFHNVEVTSGTDSDENDFTNFKNVTITVCKNSDADGDNQSEDDRSDVEGWEMTLTKDDEEVGSQETEDDGCAVWSDLGPGDYSVAEETREGWTNLNSTTHDFGTVESGETYTHTFVNTQLGSITVEKQTNPDADETTFDFTGEIEATLSDGQTDSKLNVLPGTYEVTETAKTGWDLTNIICSDENSAGNGITRTASFNVEPGEDVTCTFNNQKRGSIVVTKYQDNNGNGQQDANEPELEGWDMTLNQDGPQFPLTQSTGQDGTTTFDNLYPASYGLSETIKEGWTLSDISCTSDEKAGPSDQDSFLAQPLNNVNLNNHLVDVEPGQTTECYVGNIPPVPVLTIDKSNNTGGADKRPSQDVVFTLTVTASDSDVINTKVVDLPAGGFAYRAGSWTANSNVRGDLKAATITTEPTYASPGTWNLGDMVEGEVVTLTYVADIANDQQTGLYKDLAWTEGESLASAQVLGNESTGTFVGTDVNVITDPQTDTAEISVKKEEKKEGDVLGAVLPATGADSQWVMFGLYGLASGFLLVLIGLTMRAKKLRLGKYFAATIFAVALTLSTGAVRTEAAATNLSVRLYQPDSPSNNEDLKLNFVTLDTLSRGITARCYKKGPSDAIFTQFGSDINISPAGGNNANCVPGSAVLSSTGTYSFYVGVTADAESVSSAVVSLDFVAGNSEKPGAPYNYSKSKIESCKYRISFHTSNDSGKTVKVALYRSENTSFGIDDSNKVGEVAIGSNADGQIDNTIPDCDKTYYYAIRAYNLFGKGSDVVGDSVTVTITEGGTTTTTTAASSPAGTTTGGALPSTESQVEEGSEGAEAGEGETQGETAEGKVEEVLGAQSDKNPVQNLMRSLTSNPLGAGVGIVAFAIIVYVFVKKNPFKKVR